MTESLGCLCLCVCAVYVWGARCASSASCRRQQFSQLLKRCPKLSGHRRMFLNHASALFYHAPRGFTLSATLFQTWTWDKSCSGAAPDWLQRKSRRILMCLKKKCYCFSSVHRAQNLPLERLGDNSNNDLLLPQTDCFSEAYDGLVNHRSIYLTSKCTKKMLPFLFLLK